MLCLGALLMAGCSEPQEKKAETAPAPREPVSGQSAFQKMFVSARGWATDAQPLRVAQIDVDEIPAGQGKAAAWEAVFVSQAQGKARRYIYSVLHKPVRNLRGGVNADPPEKWVAGGGAEPFPFLAFKKDSTDAWDVAVKESREYMSENPKQPVGFVLEKTHRFPGAVWRVYWGETISTSPYSVFVDATTGQYLGRSR